MVGDVFSQSTIPVLQEVVNFAQSRHGVLAGNIVNMGTPGYQVRDLSVNAFQDQLKSAIASLNQPPEETLSPGMINEPSDPVEPLRHVRDSLKTILYHDGTNVGLEQQITEITKNQMLHNLAITIMSSQFRLLQSAVSERV